VANDKLPSARIAATARTDLSVIFLLLFLLHIQSQGARDYHGDLLSAGVHSPGCSAENGPRACRGGEGWLWGPSSDAIR
jgi:hypothetical protein